MRKLLPFFLFITFVTLSVNSFAAYPLSTPNLSGNSECYNRSKASIRNLQNLAQMRAFVTLTMSEYEKAIGRNLNFMEKIAFKTSQKRIKKLLKNYDYGDEPTVLQKIGAFCNGAILGPLAILIGYIFYKDENRELIKWMWFGSILWLLMVVGYILAFAL